LSGWQRSEPTVAPAGDCGGDVQVSDAWSARWRHELSDGATALVTRAFYIASASPDGDGPHHLECQTEYLVCTDPAEPGGTEQWSDYVYERRGPATGDEDVRQAAADAEAPTDAEWLKNAPAWVGSLAAAR